MKHAIAFIICVLTLLNKLVAQTDDNRAIRIQVVFHVLYSDTIADYGINPTARDRGNATTNVPTSKILAELKNLHDDFLLLNSDTSQVDPYFKSRIGNANVDFYLADSVFQPGGEKGIIRKFKEDNRCELYNKSEPVDPQKYLNVYVGRLKTRCAFGTATDGITNVPIDSLKRRDGCVNVSYKWIGQGYRLLTHETGHWGGLYHTFGEKGCKPKNGDGIDDTPAQRNETGLERCPAAGATDLSCDTTKPYNFNNYMDYSDCRFMFTIGQVTHLRNTIRKFRPQIWRSSIHR